MSEQSQFGFNFDQQLLEETPREILEQDVLEDDVTEAEIASQPQAEPEQPPLFEGFAPVSKSKEPEIPWTQYVRMVQMFFDGPKFEEFKGQISRLAGRTGLEAEQARRKKPYGSGIVGFYDRYTRIPYCRQTAWTMDNRQLASDTFEVLITDRYQSQKRYVESTHAEWVIPGTVFTTITVNSNWQTAQHQDSGDLRAGFGVMVCLGHDFEGGWLLFPKYKTAFKMRPGDILLSNVHEWHCNTPIRLLKEGAERLSLVCYYRENMERCGTVQEELEIAKSRQEGDPLWDPEAPLFQ